MTQVKLTTILTEQTGAIVRITLNRAEVLNAIDGRMLKEIRETLIAGGQDKSVRVFIIDSATEKAFSAGIDVAYVKDLRGFDIREVGRELHRTFLTCRITEKPIVCAIDGLCLGAGLELALSCDFMIGTDRSQYGLPNIHRGIPAIVEAAILPMAIGIQGAREMAYTGEFWDAAKAERRGLITKMVEPRALSKEVMDFAEKLAKKAPMGLATQKEIIHKWMTTDLETAIDYSVNTVPLNFATQDQKEAMQAFLEKRPAVVKGS